MRIQELATSALALKQRTLEPEHDISPNYHIAAMGRSNYHGAVQVHILIVMYLNDIFWTLLFLYTFDIFLLLVCFLPLIVHFNKRILCGFKLEGTSGEFPCCVFYRRAQNLDAVL